MFDGLYFYEILLLCTGAVLFIVLIWAFVFQIRSGSLGASLAMFFMIDIAMIGFPAIKEIQYKDGVVTLDKETIDLQNEPTNSALRNSLEKRLEDVLPRISSGGHANTKSLVTVAAAQYALGKESEARENLRNALTANQASPAALELKQKIESVDRVRELTAKLKGDPADSKTSADLREAVQQVSDTKLANPKALDTVAQAQDNLGYHKAAAANIAMAQAIFNNTGEAYSGYTASRPPAGTARAGIPRPPSGPSRPSPVRQHR